MNKEIGLDAAIYGMARRRVSSGAYGAVRGAATSSSKKVGARIWIPRIMITWGADLGATAFATGP